MFIYIVRSINRVQAKGQGLHKSNPLKMYRPSDGGSENSTVQTDPRHHREHHIVPWRYPLAEHRFEG